MNFAFARAVARLVLSAVSVAVASPSGHTLMWMFPCWSTPPRSELFEAPARSRLIVVALLPKASRNANGNSATSNGLLGQSGDRFLYFNGVHQWSTVALGSLWPILHSYFPYAPASRVWFGRIRSHRRLRSCCCRACAALPGPGIQGVHQRACSFHGSVDTVWDLTVVARRLDLFDAGACSRSCCAQAGMRDQDGDGVVCE